MSDEKLNEIPTNEEFETLALDRQREVLEMVAALHAENPEAVKALGYNIVNDYELLQELSDLDTVVEIEVDNTNLN